MINIKLSGFIMTPKLNERGELDIVNGKPIDMDVNEPSKRLPGENDMII